MDRGVNLMHHLVLDDIIKERGVVQSSFSITAVLNPILNSILETYCLYFIGPFHRTYRSVMAAFLFLETIP